MQIEMGEKLGEGTFGTTYLGSWRGGQLAVKMVRIAKPDEAESFLNLVLRTMRQILHDGHVCQPATKTLSASSVALFVEAIRGRRQDASENLIQSVDNPCFK